MLIAYARTSTAEQEAGLEAQVRDLRAAGCEKVFAEQVSSVAGRRPQLALEFVRDGDTLVVAKADRLARGVADLLGIVARLEAKRVALRILSLGGAELDTRAPTGRLMVTVLGGVAEFERYLMLERQREGISKAKAMGRYRGRAPTAPVKAAEVERLRGAGLVPVAIAREVGISRSSVHRILAAAG